MKTSTIGWIIAVLIIILGGWYWWSTSQGGLTYEPATPTAEQNTTQTTTKTTVTTQSYSTSGNLVLGFNSNSTLGNYLIGSNAMTLYRYTKDTPGKSNCSGACAVNWPPYTVTSASPLPAKAGVSGTVSTIIRADGTMQVTYNGTPLYFWYKDTKPGDTTGQNVGGVWFVVKP